MHRLGGGTYQVRFHPRWWILLSFKWDLVWNFGCSWFRLTFLGYWGWWYGRCLRLHPRMWLGPIFLFSTILVRVSVVSSLFFSVICPWNMSANFLSASTFLCLRVPTGRLVMDFLVRWSSLLPHECLHWRSKFLVLWCSQEIMPLCLQYVLLLCWKYIYLTLLLLNFQSCVPALYPIMVPCVTSVGFFIKYYIVTCWCQRCSVEVKVDLHNHVRWNLPVVSWSPEHFNVICAWSRSIFHMCIVNILSFPIIPETKLFLSVLISLTTAFLLYMSDGSNWYSIWVFQSRKLRRPHCLSSGFWFETLFLLGTCSFWSRLSTFIIKSKYLGDLLIFC